MYFGMLGHMTARPLKHEALTIILLCLIVGSLAFSLAHILRFSLSLILVFDISRGIREPNLYLGVGISSCSYGCDGRDILLGCK